MKRSTRFFALLLAFVMTASLFCTSALADRRSDPYAALRKGCGYVAIGDSFARGFGASDHWQSQIYENEYYGRFRCRNVDGSYPNLVAEAFGLNAPDDIRDKSAEFWPIAHDAVSTAYILDLLGIDDGFRDDEYTYQSKSLARRYQTDLAYFADPLSYNYEGTGTCGRAGEVMSVRDMLRDASLITIGLGQCDILYRTLMLAADELDMDDLVKSAVAVGNAVSRLYSSFEYWKNAYCLLLDYIREVNPDAKVVLIGTLNPVANTMLTKDIPLPVGSAFNILLDKMNAYTKECAKKYGCMFVDISSVDVVSTEKDTSIADMLAVDINGDDFALLTHPTPAGYAQIARMIVEAVEESLAKDAATARWLPYIPATPRTYIQVDMGRFQRLDYVMVDGKKIDNYRMDGYKLTIPHLTTTAKNLTVAAVKEDGTVTLITYALSYDKGYTAHRLYEANDAKAILTNTVKLVKTAVTKTVTFLKGLIKA